MLLLMYMDTGRHTQMHSQTCTHTDIYTTHNDTHRHMKTYKQTNITYTETYENMHS